MTLTHLDLDRIEGLAGRLRESKAEVLRLLAKDAGSLKAASVISGWIWDTDSALADLTAMITRIRELEGALTEIASHNIVRLEKEEGRTLDETAASLLYNEWHAVLNIARTALQRETP